MGLISGLVTWPLLPVRGLVWVAEQVEEEAERQFHDPAAVQAALEELDARREAGLVSEEDAAAEEEELVQRLIGGPHG